MRNAIPGWKPVFDQTFVKSLVKSLVEWLDVMVYMTYCTTSTTVVILCIELRAHLPNPTNAVAPDSVVRTAHDTGLHLAYIHKSG